MTTWVSKRHLKGKPMRTRCGKPIRMWTPLTIVKENPDCRICIRGAEADRKRADAVR